MYDFFVEIYIPVCAAMVLHYDIHTIQYVYAFLYWIYLKGNTGISAISFFGRFFFCLENLCILNRGKILYNMVGWSIWNYRYNWYNVQNIIGIYRQNGSNFSDYKNKETFGSYIGTSSFLFKNLMNNVMN